jgi:hypothetical protein
LWLTTRRSSPNRFFASVADTRLVMTDTSSKTLASSRQPAVTFSGYCIS